jgi:Asp-tRNA(Asn)/Glu-tRNA(Gln) amidotransferase A subunit family amidase
MREQWHLGVADARDLLDSRTISCRELAESCLHRIDRVDARVRAWAHIDGELVLECADARDSELRTGLTRGPLHGIPVGVKDIFSTRGIPTEGGSRTLRGSVPTEDAAVVARLKQAGAVIIGKTHTTEFAGPDPAPTRNPWNLEHTPGGSSSGSAAAVAARMCPVALGSQSGGSTIRPAAFCGIVGLKPRHGRISTYGMLPISELVDHVGVLARSVEDAALVLQELGGFDARDPYSLDKAVPDYAEPGAWDDSRPRLGVARGNIFAQADAEGRRHLDAAVDRLQDAGAAVEEVTLPVAFDDAQAAAATILSVGFAQCLGDVYAARKDDLGVGLRDQIARGLQTSAVCHAAALETRVRLAAAMRAVLDGVDALLTPATVGPAPAGLGSTGDPGMQFPWSLLGFPALTISLGLGTAGLPLGIQLAGLPQGEERLLLAARWCERVLGVALGPPLAD